MRRKPLWGLSFLGVLVALAAAGVSGATAKDNGPQRFQASLSPVPHDPNADGGSNATGRAFLWRTDNQLKVQLQVNDVSAGLPHAMHIHGKDNPEVAFCPGANRRQGGVSDDLIETVDGLTDYGPIQVSFTTRGDTSPNSGLALDRFAVAKTNEKLTYQRSLQIPSDVANHLNDKHIVVHGHDIDRDGSYDPGPITALGAPLEAELPVACGAIEPKRP